MNIIYLFVCFHLLFFNFFIYYDNYIYLFIQIICFYLLILFKPTY